MTVVCICHSASHMTAEEFQGHVTWQLAKAGAWNSVRRARCSLYLNPHSTDDWEGPGWLPLGGRITGDLKPFVFVNFLVNIYGAICFQQCFFVVVFFSEQEQLQVDSFDTHCKVCRTAASARLH